MVDITHAITSLRPGATWIIHDEDYDKLEWLDEIQTKPTLEECQVEVARLKSEYDAKEYQRLRAPEYPSIGDQLDALFHAGVFPPEMAEKIQSVKDKYPKPN